nr:hypothetical protein [Bacteroidota bacterium]
MKKIYLSLLAIFAIGTISAQRIATKGETLNYDFKFSNTRVQDTSYYSQFLTGAWVSTLYTNQGGGYVFGSNSWEDLQKVQGVMAGDALHPGVDHKVEGVGFLTKKTGTGGPNSKVLFKIYDFGPDGYPKNVLAQEEVTFMNIMDDDITWVTFANPVQFAANQSYGVGIDMSSIGAGNHIGIYSGTDGQYTTPEIIFEQWDDLD